MTVPATGAIFADQARFRSLAAAAMMGMLIDHHSRDNEGDKQQQGTADYPGTMLFDC